jgi:Peptidase propeptide and YPEB domain
MGRIAGLMVALSLVAGSVAAQAPSGAPPAQAPGSGATSSPSQTVPQPGLVLNEDEIRQKLREEGYAEVTELRLQGPSYEAKAVKNGRNVNLTVDARTGSIRSTY